MLNHIGELRTVIISSDFTSLHKSAELIKHLSKMGFLYLLLSFLHILLLVMKQMAKSIGLRMCQVVLFACWITLLNQDIFKALMKEYIWDILNPPEDKILLATFLVIRFGPAFHKNVGKTSSSFISSAGNSNTNFDNTSDFMIVIRPKRVSFILTITLTLT